MVKVFVALPRKKGITEQAFHDHWRHPHATWGLSMSRRKHYVQSHRVATQSLGDSQSRFDGIAEIWFDNEADAGAYNQDPVYKERLAPDEPNFIDMRNVRFLVADERVVMSEPNSQHDSQPSDLGWREQDRPVATKLVQMFEPGTSAWDTGKDLELGRAVGALRHVICEPNPIVHAKGAFVAGIRELWWPTVTAFERGISSAPQAWADLTAVPTLTTLLAVTERHL
jgi:uncharacterized protein (TIGR02118 family)